MMTKRKKIAKGEHVPPEFATEQSYVAFCKDITELYDKNERLTQKDLVEYCREELDVKLSIPKLRKILIKYGATIRSSASDRHRKIKARPKITISLDPDMYNFFVEMNEQFNGHTIRRAFMDLAFSIMTGVPCKHMIVWLDDFKPALFFLNEKTMKFVLVGENLSKLEISELEELLAQSEEVGHLEPVKAYARSKQLLHWGGQDKLDILSHKIHTMSR